MLAYLTPGVKASLQVYLLEEHTGEPDDQRYHRDEERIADIRQHLRTIYVLQHHRQLQPDKYKNKPVQQEDIHLPTTTVREALQFSAVLRQTDNVSEQEKMSYVDSIIELLDMSSFADAIVGVPGDGKYLPDSCTT